MKIHFLRTLTILLCVLLFSADLFGSERATAQGPRSTPTPSSSQKSIPTPTRVQNPNTRRSPATYVSPSWERSHESDAVLCDAVGGCLEAGLGLLTYPDNVWDNGTYFPNPPSVPGIQWASWPQINRGDIRRFKATFTFPDNLNPNATQCIIFDPYYDVDIVPINDNIYIFINGTQVYTGGTSHNNAINGQTGGHPSYTAETDGWYVPAPVIITGFKSGINTIDVLTEERAYWGGLGYLTLRFSPRESLYAISGRVTYDNGTDVPGVTITSSSGSSAITDASGYYTLTNVITGTYTLTPTKSGYRFAPSTVTLPNVTSNTTANFVIRPMTPTGFLDLPVNYSTATNLLQRTLDFRTAASGSKKGIPPGRINSWFDHFYPQYGSNSQVYLYTGKQYPITGGCTYGLDCYDNHPGLDFNKDGPGDNPILAAASGVVTDVVRYDDGGYGVHLMIDHENGYATLYGHLKLNSIPNHFTNGVTRVNAGDQIGVMGNTGYVIPKTDGTHLHFGLYYDKDGDKKWMLFRESRSVDPFGWLGQSEDCSGQLRGTADPWSVPSFYLWKYRTWEQICADSTGVIITNAGTSANIPPGALVSMVNLQLLNSIPVANPLSQLRSIGRSFWLRVWEWISGSGVNSASTKRPANGSFLQPVTLTVTYTDNDVKHLNPNQLTIYRWNETTSMWVGLPTTVDTNLHQATAQTTEIGNFDLQAPLLCPADTLEVDDNYYAATNVIDRTRVTHLFDIAQDEDWLKLNTIAGSKYQIWTSNLAANVDTVLQVYNIDGVTLLASDDNSGGGKASRLIWQAPQTGTYFVRVGQAPGSAFGCSAAYQLTVSQGFDGFFPFVTK